MKIVNLIVVAHPDDEILGFGATGAKLSQCGEVVQPIILCGNVDVRTNRPRDEELLADIHAANAVVGFSGPVLGDFPNLRMNTVDHINIVQFIEKQIEKYEPERIFTHHPADLNNDHVQVAHACLAASRLFQRRPDVQVVRSLHLMEVQSATDWSFGVEKESFSPNLFIEVKNELDQKIEALSCYRNVVREYPHPRSSEAIKGLAAYRGGQSGQDCSEAFQTVFMRELS